MWVHRNNFAVGGLENVGFAEQSDKLIVLSSQGRGIFDCLTGQKIFRDDNEWWPTFEENRQTVIGFGELNNLPIKTCGLYGGDIFPKKTHDGWMLKSEKTPEDPPFEKYLVNRIYLIDPNSKKYILVGKDGACELRAWGFSDTGKSFIIALSCELIIWSRE